MAVPAVREASRRRRVLIVDDDPLIRRVVRAVLEDSAYVLDEAASGAEALRVAARRPPDVVLLDVMMPGIDGFEVLTRIRKDPRLNRAIVVMLTARDTAADRERGKACGADVYFTKPFSPLQLLRAVESALK